MNHLHDEDGPVFIFAGYQMEMEKYIETNPGFEHQVPNILHFADYSCTNLFEIMHVIILSIFGRYWSILVDIGHSSWQDNTFRRDNWNADLYQIIFYSS